MPLSVFGRWLPDVHFCKFFTCKIIKRLLNVKQRLELDTVSQRIQKFGSIFRANESQYMCLVSIKNALGS